MSYIYVVQMNIPAQYEADFNRVYDTEHVPMLSKVPGVHKVSRYRLEQSNDPGMQKAWKQAGEWGDWAPKIRPHTTERHHSFFEKI